MWKPFRQLMPKEHSGPSGGLEGRTIDVGNVKVHVREAIAEGGFSCVYLARDLTNPAKQYALKHVIVHDKESLDLVQKEITVMRALKGHPNVVTLVAHAILDMGRGREALLLMEFCERSLVSALDTRGTAGFYDEEQVALIFRDVCNAVFAMHCQTPPVAHRDLKAENVLLGADGAWKLCDFGSVSTNHKCFDKPEERGIEEDVIRKHTTPAYRAPEMWDLYRREVISEKVDIWALGCLMYRICYLKSAFDGESKLQILNGNYRIPELPKYCSSITSLIEEMLQSSPDARPDITQVWFRVNELLPLELQKDLPDGSPSGSAFELQTTEDEGPSPSWSRDNVRSTPPKGPSSLRSQVPVESKGSAGAFWSTQHAQELAFADDKGSVLDQEPIYDGITKQPQAKNQNTTRNAYRQSLSASVDSSPGDFEIRFSPNGSEYGLEKTQNTKPDNKTSAQTATFSSFVADFDNVQVSSEDNAGSLNTTSKLKEQQLEAEVTLLKEQLKIANLEKEEISLKFDRLSAICSSQRREIQELKQALATASAPAPVKELKENLKAESSPPSTSLDTPPREKIAGTPPELRQGLFTSSPGTPSPDPKPWSAFPEEPKAQAVVKCARPRSVRTLRASQSNKAGSLSQSKANSGAVPFAFGQDSFKAVPSGTVPSEMSNLGNASQSLNTLKAEVEKDAPYQPAGWTGF
ncbi:AP2-associated protein kinase 1-like [Triticum urartu]|uniref:Protein kinase domain-containing protein n=1 Tax=Triticum urartu TaxID=4572 RepID=A0A8R7QED9_TRIUA|nr:AP2-associated protein kinase 1-like [Triticum urartu]